MYVTSLPLFQTAANFGAVLDDPENNPFRSQYSFSASITVPREVQMLDTCSSELRAAAHACIKAVVECFDSRKTIYLTQLKKIRETSNMATRNAVQHERSEASIFIAKLRDALDTQRRKEVSDAQARVTELDAIVTQLRATADITSQEMARLTQLEQNRLSLQQTAVAEAVKHLKEDSQRDKLHMQEAAAAEHRRLQAEAQAIVDDMKLQAEVSYGPSFNSKRAPTNSSVYVLHVFSHASPRRKSTTRSCARCWCKTRRAWKAKWPSCEKSSSTLSQRFNRFVSDLSRKLF